MLKQTDSLDYFTAQRPSTTEYCPSKERDLSCRVRYQLVDAYLNSVACLVTQFDLN
jgi:hypothetical protein